MHLLKMRNVKIEFKCLYRIKLNSDYDDINAYYNSEENPKITRLISSEHKSCKVEFVQCTQTLKKRVPTIRTTLQVVVLKVYLTRKGKRTIGTIYYPQQTM